MNDGRPSGPDRGWARIEALLLRVLDAAPADRERILREDCDDDADLRREVESLVAEHERDPDFLEQTPPWLVATDEELRPDAGPDPTTPPELERIGPYRVVRLLGRGGMGSVYLAEWRVEDVTRSVAVKLVRHGLDTDDIVARFRAERRILARLAHPNIAGLLDVGATAEGRPYLVMEYVDGEPLVDWCDARGLGLAARLDLMREVCGAVEHAHRHLVVHRDLKPSNILVTAEGVPKLLDFGIAKILDPDEAVTDGLTRVGERLLTPRYAAPEQIRGEAVTTAVDLYALGVLLYELLTGRRPADATLDPTLDPALDPGSGVPSRSEVERAVLERDPPIPSRIAAASRRAYRIPRDLDTVVLHALRKEPEARYTSASALAADLDRAKKGFPVEARPSTPGYRLRRFAQRNPALVAASLTATLVVGVSAVLLVLQSARIQAEAARVERERDKALEVRGFLLETFGATGPDQPTGEALTARALLDNRARLVEEEFGDDPEMRAEMLTVLAEAYERLGLPDRAEPPAREALALRNDVFGPDDPETAAAAALLGWIQHGAGRADDATAQLRRAVEIGRATAVEDQDERFARALNDLGVVREATGDYDEAEALYRESLEVRRRISGSEAEASAVTASNLSVLLYRRGEIEAAVEAAEDALVRFEAAFGPDHQRTTIVQSNLAAMRSALGDHVGAAAEHRTLLERRRRVFGDDHPQVAFSMTMLANELVALERPAEAEPLVEDALAIQRAAHGPRHPDVASTLRVLAHVRLADGRPDAAIADFQEALDLTRELRGPDHPEVAVILGRIGEAHQDAGRLPEALDYFGRAHDLRVRLYGVDDLRTADLAVALARARVEAGDTVGLALLIDQVAHSLDAAGAPDDHGLRAWVDWLRTHTGGGAP